MKKIKTYSERDKKIEMLRCLCDICGIGDCKIQFKIEDTDYNFCCKEHLQQFFNDEIKKENK